MFWRKSLEIYLFLETSSFLQMTYQQLGRKVSEGKISSSIFEHAWIQLLLLTAEFIWGQISQSSQMSSSGGCLVWELKQKLCYSIMWTIKRRESLHSDPWKPRLKKLWQWMSNSSSSLKNRFHFLGLKNLSCFLFIKKYFTGSMITKCNKPNLELNEIRRTTSLFAATQKHCLRRDYRCNDFT